jgi:alpha-N-arabinofuranosidase
MEPKLDMPKGVENKTGKDGFFPNGNFTYEEDFSSDDLDKRWIGLRGPREAFIEKAKNGIQINPFEANVKEVKPTSTLFYRQMHNSFSYAATLDYKPESEKDLAGIVALQSENANYVFGVTKQGDDYVLVLQRNFKRRFRGEMDSKVIASTKIELSEPLRLQVSAKGDKYEFSYAVEGADFVRLGETVSGDILSTDVAGGFTGCLLGLYATSANDALPE